MNLRSGNQPSAKRIRTFLQRELSRLDPDRPLARQDAVLRYRDDDVEIVFRPVALLPDRRGDATLRMMSGPPSISRGGGTAAPLVAAVEEKGTRYGRLAAPYVIAINALSEWGTRREDMIDALYGERWTSTEAQLAARRSPPARGVFSGTFTGVSAVFVTTAVPWNLPYASAVLLHNPHAEHPYSGELCAFTEARLSEGGIVWKEGLQLGEVLGITAGPEE